jgi:hypothetical protein
MARCRRVRVVLMIQSYRYEGSSQDKVQDTVNIYRDQVTARASAQPAANPLHPATAICSMARFMIPDQADGS